MIAGGVKMNVIYFFQKLGYNPRVDSLLTLAFNRVIIDVFDLEKQVYRKYGIDENSNVSLLEVLKSHYDNDIIEKIMYYTGATK